MRKLTEKVMEAVRRRQSAIFALLWQMLRSRLPPDVLEDFNKFLRDTGIRRMDAGGSMAEDGNLGTYTVEMGDNEYTFHLVDLAPPAGVVAENYSRSASFNLSCLLTLT
jgi:hypothetical protein